jgi:hypothetical protein
MADEAAPNTRMSLDRNELVAKRIRDKDGLCHGTLDALSVLIAPPRLAAFPAPSPKFL